MKQYLIDFLQSFAYDERDRKELLAAYDAVCADPAGAAKWKEWMALYENDMLCDLSAMRAQLGEIAEACRLHVYTLDLLFHICLSRATKTYYETYGISEQIYRDSMMDLKYKLVECREVYGICGSFVGAWFARFFNLSRFALGRLQFELSPFEKEYDKNGIHLPPKSRVINIHIPRTGTPMDEAACDESFAQAASFFANELEGEPIVFRCHSWLLFPAHEEMLPEHSNIRKFAARFECVESGEYGDYNELWRLFDRTYPGTPEKLPYATSLHRAYVDRIKAGKKTGWGLGIFVYKGK